MKAKGIILPISHHGNSTPTPPWFLALADNLEFLHEFVNGCLRYICFKPEESVTDGHCGPAEFLSHLHSNLGWEWHWGVRATAVCGLWTHLMGWFYREPKEAILRKKETQFFPQALCPWALLVLPHCVCSKCVFRGRDGVIHLLIKESGNGSGTN